MRGAHVDGSRIRMKIEFECKEGNLKNTTTKSPTITNTNKLVLGSNKDYISNLTWSVVEL